MPKDLFEHLKERYFGGVNVRFADGTPKVVNVGTTATQVLPGNPQRLAWIVVNKSGNPGHMDYENKVATNRGLPVSQNGGTVDSHFEKDGATVQSALFGINETAAGDWYVVAWELAE